MERWVTKQLPNTLRILVISFFIISLALLIIAYGSIAIIILFIPVAYIGARFSDSFLKYTMYFLAVGLVLSVLQQWILPESWIIAMAYPLEWICDVSQKIPVINSFLPDYTASEFVTSYQRFFEAFNINLDQENIKIYILKIYVFATKGILILIILLLDILAVVFGGLAIFLMFLVPFYFIIQLSKYLTKLFKLEDKVIPIGAFMIWSTGEIISFYYATRDFLFSS
ncbi:MAG: hypothetical protein AAF617_07500 [Bacteroidota bacterium]